MAYDWFTLHFPITSHFRANFLYLFSQTNFFLIHFQMALHYDGSVKYYAWRFNSDLSSLRNGNIFHFKAFASIFNKSIEHGIFQKKSTRIPFSSHCCCSNRNPLRKERKWKKLMIWFSSISIELAAVKNGI